MLLNDLNGTTKDCLGNEVRLIAFYLPQFHPIPENDLWWGKGFTEWTNVTKAEAWYDGHYQPHLPADLGYYDLRLRQSRHDQMALAKAYGIDGFCYHYYWFSGKRLLEKPLDAMLEDPMHKMPFCISWANENWTRRWDAAEHEILIAQKYLPEDDLEFIKSTEKYLRDPRYIRLNDKPVLLVYRPQHLFDPMRATEIWREHCLSIGLGDIHLVCALTHRNWDYAQYGFDSGVEFPPHNIDAPNHAEQLPLSRPSSIYFADMADIAEQYLARDYSPEQDVFRTVFPSWDNTARRGENALVTLNGTPSNYEYWLSEALSKTQKEFPGEQRFVFINSWNEWAEGCHLEPDQRYGHGFLKATWRARNTSPLRTWPNRGAASLSAHTDLCK